MGMQIKVKLDTDYFPNSNFSFPIKLWEGAGNPEDSSVVLSFVDNIRGNIDCNGRLAQW